jgi:photosystem II stability/assembly factor-like uncharacterized protein
MVVYNTIYAKLNNLIRRQNIMKNALFAVMSILLALTSLMGCAPVAVSTATTLPPTATILSPTVVPSMVPSLTPSVGPWKVMRQAQYEQSIYQAGFLDDSFGIMVGYNGAVYYSADGGQSWSQGQNTSACRFGLDIVDQQTAWNCGNGGHVRVTTDGGKNWQAVADFGGSEPDQCRFLSFLDAQTGWASTPQLLAATTDGGATWNTLALPKGINDVTTIALRTATEGYLLDTTGTVFVTTDGGKTWTTHSLGLASNEKLTIAKAPTAAIRFTDAQNGMVVFDLDDGVFSAQTTDGGQTWKREPVAIPYDAPNLYLAHDGLTLTAIDGLANLIVLQYQKP